MNWSSLLIGHFEEQFGTSPSYIARAPGRVNLIGGSTDYNEGFVLPAAIDRAIWAAFTPRSDDVVRLVSYNFDRQIDFSVAYLSRGQGWQEYIKGVVWAIKEAGHSVRGFDIVIGGDVPRGAGLSSSAALEMAAARAVTTSAGIPWDAPAMAQACQRAENEWVGLNCGIMDQLISAMGVDNHALLIDCRTLATHQVRLPDECSIVVLDTATRRNLSDSEYNARRHECEQVARQLGVPFLRDASLPHLEATDLPAHLHKRAKHVITENQRVRDAAEALQAGDLDGFGALINASHDSLATDFEVSSDALEAMVACARQHEACYGVRLSGAGYAGCCVAVVQTAHAEGFSVATATCYEAATGLTPTVYICKAARGSEVHPLSGNSGDILQ